MASPSPSGSSQLLGASKEAASSHESQHEQALAIISHDPPKTKKWYARKKLIALVALVSIIVIFLAIFLPVFFVVVRKKTSTGEGASGAPAGSGPIGGPGGGIPNPASPSGATSGGDGSIVKLANGTEFTYRNSFGGFWVQDPGNPYNNNARPNSWTPPLNTTWKWGKDRVYGVNLGGLFVLEPFITPPLFQRYPGAVDEWTLSTLMAADTTHGGLKQLEEHYNTFITEQDIAEIAGAGLNFLRIPIAFWAIETWEGEPFLEKTSWKYFLRILEWARKYGLRVCLDLHAVPGSQNGYNHSGRLSPVNFMSGNMGIANAQRTLYYIRVLTEFISQPEYRDLVPIFGIINEALVGLIGIDSMTSFYLEAHTMIRNITGKGEGHGPYIAIHDGFQATSIWDHFLEGSDRIALDGHPYFSFGGPQLAPIDVVGPQGVLGGTWPRAACDNWGPRTNQSRVRFGVNFAGEFAASPNDCGLFLRGVNDVSTNPLCPKYNAWESYTDDMKGGIKNFVSASFDALGDWFFWTWKIGPSQVSGKIETPLWSYQLGLRNGWIPKDPRTARGMCESLEAASEPFDGDFKPWQTGGVPSSIPASSTARFPWPPTTINAANVPISLLPTYTNTAPLITMPPAVFTSAPASVTKSADGWFNNQDSQGGITAVAGCPYPDKYFGVFSVVPTAPCTGPVSVPTPPPA